MAWDDAESNGAFLLDSMSSGGGLAGEDSQRVNGHVQSIGAVFDARVHSIPAIGPIHDAAITILLRRQGQFIHGLVEQDSADAGSLDRARRLTTESLVRISGSTVFGDRSGQDGGVSDVTTVRVHKLVVLSEAKAGIVQGPKMHGAPGEQVPPLESRVSLIDERLGNRLLDARVASTAAIFKLFSGVHELAVGYLAARGFYQIPTPAFINYEYPGEEDDHFSVRYFDETAWLAPTGEVHLGMALAADLERVYDIHTVFRREEDVDGRHLTEFTMLELVFNLQNDWTEVLDLADDLLVFLIRSLQESSKYITLMQTAQRLYPLAGSFKLGLDENCKLPRIRFSEAKAILRHRLGHQCNDEDDLSREEEAALGRFFSSDTSYLGAPTDVFIVSHYPTHLRPCNIHPSDESGLTHSFDVILRGQEIITGCQLLHSHKELRSAFAKRAHPIDPDSPGWRPYVVAHEIGMPPWGGFGLGLNRLIQGFLGLSDIRETVLFPRDASRLVP